jgi:hypothetical protein
MWSERDWTGPTYAYHRRPLGETDRNHRVVSIDEMHFDARGMIEPVKITNVGVRPASAAFDGNTLPPSLKLGHQSLVELVEYGSAAGTPRSSRGTYRKQAIESSGTGANRFEVGMCRAALVEIARDLDVVCEAKLVRIPTMREQQHQISSAWNSCEAEVSGADRPRFDA